MPETAVDEDHLAPPGKDQVGGAGQIAAMQTEAIAESVDEATNDYLGARVLPSNARHAAGTASGGECVHKLARYPSATNPQPQLPSRHSENAWPSV